MRHSLAACVLFASLVSVQGSAFALDVPARKPGLWSITLGMAAMPGGMTSQHCIDASVDQMRNPVTGNARTEQCSKLSFDKTATGYTFDSTCEMDGGVIQSHGIVTGSFDSAYKMDITTKNSKPVAGMSGDMHMTIDAKWLSACKPGQRPGDVVMPNGMTVNVIDMAKGGMPMQQRPGGGMMPPPK